MIDEINIKELSDRCKESHQLFNLMIVLLSACNQNCVHCYIPEHADKGLPFEDVCRVIRQARELGALNLTLTGGEIFVREDIFDIIQEAKSQHMRVFIMSNASLIDSVKADKLKDLGIAEFSTTLFSMDEAVHDGIARHPGAFRKTINAIDMIKARKIPVTVKTPLMEANKYGYRDVEKYADSNGFNFMTTTTIFSKSNGDSSPHDLGIKSDLCNIVKETKEILLKYRDNEIDYRKEGIPCGAGFNSITVNYDGEVWPCNSLFLQVGNIFQRSLIEIWNNSERLIEWRRKAILPIKDCILCELKDKCLRCPGMAFLEDGDLYGCSSSAKKIAELL